jgi:deoxycytidylate deaminase
MISLIKSLCSMSEDRYLFGRNEKAQASFVEMRSECPSRQTAAEFLDLPHQPLATCYSAGYEGTVLRTPDEFASAWKRSDINARFITKIADYKQQYKQQYPLGDQSYRDFMDTRRAVQAKNRRRNPPYPISLMQQINLCLPSI